MNALNIQICIASGGVTRVTALGRNGDDRARAVDFLSRILPELESIDAAAKLSALRTDAFDITPESSAIRTDQIDASN